LFLVLMPMYFETLFYKSTYRLTVLLTKYLFLGCIRKPLTHLSGNVGAMQEALRPQRP